MRRGVSAQAKGATLLLVGVVIGAGLVFVTGSLAGVFTRTVTSTKTVTHLSTITAVNTTGPPAQYAQITVTVSTCQWGGAHEYCEANISNTGSMGTATTGYCVLNYGGQLYDGYTGPTLGSAVSPGAPQQLIPGGSAISFCQGSSGGPAGAGALLTGAFNLADGGEAVYTINATS